jgi:hypothetical protein
VGRIEQFVADHCSASASVVAFSAETAAFCEAAAKANADANNLDVAALPNDLKAQFAANVADIKDVLKVSPKDIAPSVKKELAGVSTMQKVLASHGYTVDAKVQAALDKLSTDLSFTDDVVTKYVNDTCGNG